MAMQTDGEPSFSELRKSLPFKPEEPSAPIYSIEEPIELKVSTLRRRETLQQCKTSSATESVDATRRERQNLQKQMMKVEVDLKKTYMRQEQLEKERKLVLENFKVRAQLLDAEVDVLLTLLRSLQTSVQSDLEVEEHIEAGPSHQVASPRDRSDSRAASVSSQSVTRQIPAAAPRSPTASLGLDQLGVLDCVRVRQLRSQELEESYEVVAPGEDLVIFRANVYVCQVAGKSTLHCELIDAEVKEVATFRCGEDGSMELYVRGRLVSKVKRARTCVKPVLVVHDARATPVLKLKGPGIGRDKHIFQVQTVCKLNIGLLNKHPAPASTLYDERHALLQFPLDLDVDFKVALIAANFLVVDSKLARMRASRLYAALKAATEPASQPLSQLASKPQGPVPKPYPTAQFSQSHPTRSQAVTNVPTSAPRKSSCRDNLQVDTKGGPR